MIVFSLLIATSSFNLTGFWHSEPDLSEGYESCYFFWDTGEYAFFESMEQGYVYTGNWLLKGDELVLKLTDAVTVSGYSVNIRLSETVVDLSSSAGISHRIFLDGEYYYLLDRDPQSAIISLVPTWGMTGSERDAFSTYD